MSEQNRRQDGVRGGRNAPEMDESIDEIEEREPRNTPTLIRTYGEFWIPELVKPTGKRLMGRKGTSRRNGGINVYEERGVYVLYKDFQPVYVGRADKESIGARIQKHRNSQRKGPRWDRFSWFGICGLKANGELRARNDAFHPTTQELIATLEALLIATIDPRLNSRREKFRNAVRLIQSDEDRPEDIEDRLGSIEEKLEKLLMRRGIE